MPFSNLFPKVSQALSKCFFKWINWIKSRIPLWIWKILFVLSSYEFLAIMEGKNRKGPFFRVQSDELMVWDAISLSRTPDLMSSSNLHATYSTAPGWPDKFRTFWEAHKNLPHAFALYIYLVNVQTMRKLFSNFVCFSECPNFKNPFRRSFNMYGPI